MPLPEPEQEVQPDFATHPEYQQFFDFLIAGGQPETKPQLYSPMSGAKGSTTMCSHSRPHRHNQSTNKTQVTSCLGQNMLTRTNPISFPESSPLRSLSPLSIS